MKAIVDANVLINALITPTGKAADILLDPLERVEKFSCYYLYVEVLKHKDKILKASKLTEPEFLEVLYAFLKKIKFYNEIQIPQEVWIEAERLTADIDFKDIAYVALSLHLDGFIWTGDKPLIQGLQAKGFNKVVTTAELFDSLT
jgi:predicted nucleic acid-binding protein